MGRAQVRLIRVENGNDGDIQALRSGHDLGREVMVGDIGHERFWQIPIGSNFDENPFGFNDVILEIAEQSDFVMSTGGGCIYQFIGGHDPGCIVACQALDEIRYGLILTPLVQARESVATGHILHTCDIGISVFHDHDVLF